MRRRARRRKDMAEAMENDHEGPIPGRTCGTTEDEARLRRGLRDARELVPED